MPTSCAHEEDTEGQEANTTLAMETAIAWLPICYNLPFILPFVC